MASTSDDGYADITPLKDGGVLKKVLKEGVGIAKCPNGTTVTVHYTGTLENGEQFDSSRDRGKPFEFSLGKKQVIGGWDIGVATMKKGEQAVFKIRSDYAYGDGGQPPSIPPKATLIFDVELIDWEAEDISPDKDKTILKTCIVDGEKLANPSDTSPVTVHVTGTHEGRVFYDKEVSFILGEASEVGLPEGVDKALKKFTKGEKSIIELKGTRFTYGANPPAEYNLPPNVPIQFTIFLKSYEKVPATWEMSTEDKLKCAREAKDRGTKFLQENKLKLALNKYKRIEDVLEYEKTTDSEPKAERDSLLLAAYLNLALTASKMNEQTECVKWCDKALEMSENNVKALYRKGGAKLAMNDLDEAKQIYKKIIEVEPDNKAATQQLLVCDQKRREQLEKEKKRFKNLFSKLNDDDKGQPQAETSGDVNMADDDGAVPSTSGAAVQASA